MSEVSRGVIIYPPELATEELFLKWVEIYRGTNWIPTYMAKRDELLAKGESVIALEIIRDIEHQTRKFDISKQGLRAKLR